MTNQNKRAQRKRVLNKGKSIRIPFSNDMDANGAEYDMDTVSRLLDENISLDDLKQQLKTNGIKNSRKRTKQTNSLRPITTSLVQNDIKNDTVRNGTDTNKTNTASMENNNFRNNNLEIHNHKFANNSKIDKNTIVDQNDELRYHRHYYPNERVYVNHLFSLDDQFDLNNDMTYKAKNKKTHSKKKKVSHKLKENERRDNDGLILSTSAGQVRVNNKIAEQFMHGRRRLKIKNQYSSGDDLLNFSDEFNTSQDNDNNISKIAMSFDGFNNIENDANNNIENNKSIKNAFMNSTSINNMSNNSVSTNNVSNHNVSNHNVSNGDISHNDTFIKNNIEKDNVQIINNIVSKANLQIKGINNMATNKSANNDLQNNMIHNSIDTRFNNINSSHVNLSKITSSQMNQSNLSKFNTSNISNESNTNLFTWTVNTPPPLKNDFDTTNTHTIQAPITRQPSYIEIPIHDRTTERNNNSQSFYYYNTDTTDAMNTTKLNFKKNYPYGEVAMPLTGKTVVNGNYDTNIDWNKTICKKFGDTPDTSYIYDADMSTRTDIEADSKNDIDLDKLFNDINNSINDEIDNEINIKINNEIDNEVNTNLNINFDKSLFNKTNYKWINKFNNANYAISDIPQKSSYKNEVSPNYLYNDEYINDTNIYRWNSTNNIDMNTNTSNISLSADELKKNDINLKMDCEKNFNIDNEIQNVINNPSDEIDTVLNKINNDFDNESNNNLYANINWNNIDLISNDNMLFNSDKYPMMDHTSSQYIDTSNNSINLADYINTTISTEPIDTAKYPYKELDNSSNNAFNNELINMSTMMPPLAKNNINNTTGITDANAINIGTINFSGLSFLAPSSLTSSSSLSPNWLNMSSNISDNKSDTSIKFDEIKLNTSDKTDQSKINSLNNVNTYMSYDLNNLVVPEKYYQTNQNIPRTADEWHEKNIAGDVRFKEHLPSANVVVNNNALTDQDEERIINSISIGGKSMNQNEIDADSFVRINNRASAKSPVAPDFFNQQRIHQAAIQKYGEKKPQEVNLDELIMPQTDEITAVKTHAGMTASIALSVKLRDMKELVTEFAKNVNKIDHCVYDQMNDTLFRMLKCAAKIKRRSHHKTTFYELDTDCEFFRDLIKMAVKLQYLSPKKGLYGKLVASIDEIGKIIGGFLRNIDKYDKKK